ncbi:hypothetical protein AMTR_s00109p00116050 [Amborella trichopoda]|uniref:Uncharacterized protein n=1 Tax=Amborella trichopoda TaxID=13333 RepID=W1NVI6_AMBTC|nr:hypothetical protein AMTR_s00109p00116050 [Amborella trichopoda]
MAFKVFTISNDLALLLSLSILIIDIAVVTFYDTNCSYQRHTVASGGYDVVCLHGCIVAQYAAHRRSHLGGRVLVVVWGGHSSFTHVLIVLCEVFFQEK